MASSKAVNVPTDPRIKEKDVNNKLQLYGIYSAFAQGKVPSNKQIDVALNSALAWGPMSHPVKSLSSDGQTLVSDLRDVIEKAKVLLLSKNSGNLLQDFIWQTQMIGTGNASTPNAPIDKDTAKQHGQQAVEGLRTLGELLITNGQFRKLLSDASVLLRDIAGDAAQKTANKVNPSEDALNNIDEPAADNTWHETPDLSRDNLKNQAKSRMPIGKGDLKDVAGDATQAAHPSGSRDPAEAADLAAQDQQQGSNSGVDAKSGAKQGLQNLKEKVSAGTDEDKKQQAREYRERTNEYFKTKLPKERREQIVYRLKKMVVEIQGHEDYQQAIDTLLRLAEEYQGHAVNVAGQSHGAVKDAHGQDTLQSAEADLKTLLERFANGTSFDDIFDSLNQIYRDADRDPELKDWFKSMDRYIRKCLKEQGYILQDDADEQWRRLYDHGNFLLRDRYRNHTDRILDEVKYVVGQFDEDPQNQAFAKSMNKLFLDLGNDENGQPTFKPHLVKDLTEVILPGFFEHIRYVPIPRIEYSDPMIDAVIENLVIEGDNLAPNMFEMGSDNYWRWGRKSFTSKNKNKVMLSVSGIQMDLRDVSYYIKKKEGFPSITDKGLMDIFMGGTGLSFKVAMENADKSDKHFLKINTVVVDIKNMNIKLKQSNHKLLFALFKPLLLKVMRPIIQKVAEKQIRDNFAKLDGMAYQIKKEADRAQAEALNNPDPEHLQNMYQRYFTAFQQQMSKANQKKEEAKEKSADKHVNVAMTQHDSMFKNLSLPGGISSKATEYKELALKGDKWESPVFSIGSARESSNIPSAGEPQRKNHSVTEGGVRGGRGLDNQGMSDKVPTSSSGNDYNNSSAQYGSSGLAGSTGAQSGAQYGSSGLAGSTGAQSGAQYGSSGLAGSTGAQSGGFANQVDNAFGENTQGSGLPTRGATGASSVIPGYDGAASTGTGSAAQQGTFLGRNNPVFHGDA